MRVGILTFHRALNYGAYLQCFALNKILRDMGCDTYIIDYNPLWMQRAYEWINFRVFFSLALKQGIKGIGLLYKRKLRYDAFGNCLAYLNLYKDVDTTKLCNYFDVIITGSDQIWNKQYTGSFDKYYFGDFIHSEKPNLISYAPSMDNLDFNSKELEHLKTLLSRYNALSAREEDMTKFLQSLTGSNITQVVDPTFLLSKKEWLTYISYSKIKINKGYLLLYQAKFEKDVYDKAKQYAKKIGKDLVVLSAGYNEDYDSTYWNANPFDFLNMTNNADIVLTTSFHGTALSLIFNKPFMVISTPDFKNVRSLNLLDKFHLKHSIINLDSDIDVPIYDWKFVNQKIKDMKQDSIDYIKNNI